MKNLECALRNFIRIAAFPQTGRQMLDIRRTDRVCSFLQHILFPPFCCAERFPEQHKNNAENNKDKYKVDPSHG
ncbi:hypothetical protein D3C75_913100 [compost metagenome]